MSVNIQSSADKLPILDHQLAANEKRIEDWVDQSTFMEGALIVSHWTSPLSWSQEELINDQTHLSCESERFSRSGRLLTNFLEGFYRLLELLLKRFER